ncbi:MAG: DNA glycosylase, partial [Clostridia bacterium]
MKIEIKSQYTDILDTDDFVLRHIFECGQCFRWHEAGGEYIGIAGGRAARITQLQNGARITCTKQDFNEFWYDYFDLKRNYADIRAQLGRDARMTDAIAFGTGIRILAQEPWEALCSFIISQCNNIPRIQGIIEKLCAMLGDEIVFEGDTYMTFPSAARVAQCT